MSILNSFSSMKYILGLGIILLIAYLTFSQPTSSVSYSNIKYEEMDATHPFSIQATNLIESKSEQDSITKSRLNKYDVRYAIDSIFRSKDLGIVNDTCLLFGTMSLPVASYNPEKKIGYIWLDYDRLGAGLMDEKLGNTKSQKRCELEFLNELDIGLEIYFDNKNQFLDDVFGNDSIVKSEAEKQIIRQEWNLAFDSLRNNLLTYEDIRLRNEAFNRTNFRTEYSVLKDWNFFGKTLKRESETVRNFGKEVRSQLKGLKSYSDQKEYLEVVLQDMRKQLEVEYIASNEKKSILDDWKLSAAEVIEEPDRFFGVTKRMDQIRMHWPSQELISALNNQVVQISTSKNSKSWWKHTNALIALFDANKSPSLCSKKRYQKLLADIMNNGEYTKWEDRYHEINELSGKENISLQELKSLNGIAYKSGIYLAPISVLDDRLIYDMKEEEHLQKMDSLRIEIGKTKNKSTRKKLQEELLESSSYRATNYGDIRREAKQKSMDILIKDFNLFIEWAEEEAEKREVERV